MMTTLPRLLLVLLLLASCQPAPKSASGDNATEQVEAVEESLTAVPTTVTGTTAESAATDEPEASTTDEATATNTPRPTAGGLETIINANARSCPWLTCPVLASFAKGVLLDGGQLVEGGRLEGNKGWWRITHEGQVMYIHDSLVRQR